jgi:hypothetical protein
MKSVITISRHWNNPKITTTISQEGISLQIDIQDFMKGIVEEMGSIATTFTKSAFEKKLTDAINVVLEKVKEESIKVV